MSTTVAINTAISFFVHTLEAFEHKGFPFLRPLIETIEHYHKQFRNNGSIEYLQKIIDQLNTYQIYKDAMKYMFDLGADIISDIIAYLRKNYNEFLQTLAVHLLELYSYFLKIYVKHYLKNEELRKIIDYLKGVASKETLMEMIYDDSILIMIISILYPPESTIGGVINMISDVMSPTHSIVSESNHTEDDVSNLLSRMQHKIIPLIEDNNTPDSNHKEDNISNLLSRMENRIIPQINDELIVNVDITISNESDSSVFYNSHHSHHHSSAVSPSQSTDFDTSNVHEDVLMVPAHNHNIEFINEHDNIITSNSRNSPIIEKSYEESKQDRLKRILGKYGRGKCHEHDKSPPKIGCDYF